MEIHRTRAHEYITLVGSASVYAVSLERKIEPRDSRKKDAQSRL